MLYSPQVHCDIYFPPGENNISTQETIFSVILDSFESQQQAIQGRRTSIHISNWLETDDTFHLVISSISAIKKVDALNHSERKKYT